MDPDTKPEAPAAFPDLAEHHRCQAELYTALAAYQHACTGEAMPSPGAFGLAIHCTIDGDQLTAVLTHAAGGAIHSGPLVMGGMELLDLSAMAAGLLLNPLAKASTPAKAEAPAPVVVTPDPEPAPVDLDAIDAEPIAAEPPSDEEIEAVTLQLEVIHAKDAGAVKPIITAYKQQHDIGRTPFIRSITTRERLTTIQQLIAEHTT